MQEFNKGFSAGVCSLAGFIVVYLTVYQLIVERLNAKRIDEYRRVLDICRDAGLLADRVPQPVLNEEDPADESGSDQASSSASNLSRADVKQGDDR